ncbi:REP-associated tyrosine transposase [Klebsiella spallanzanii]|uniref:REP-associated tyrosine transposase n=1 Tax=Klebsiella spallanzanii TaxID=2587528 RepID=A0A564NZG9_9ENTR|nr:transposase [Klebsiella spallanzanii]VUT11548.1 REP-associated tyrosine transposase [Klebsiella spallanzanii]
MVAYRRYYLKGGTWFFTVNLRNRKSALLTEHIGDLRNAILTIKRRKPFYINAWTILPEHLHCIWTLPEDDSDFSARWRDIKGYFSKALKQENIWQPRFWEHAIRDEEDYRRHIDYAYINPVKHGWVRQVRDWPFSTFHRDVRRGLYPANWGGDIHNFCCGERL